MHLELLVCVSLVGELQLLLVVDVSVLDLGLRLWSERAGVL